MEERSSKYRKIWQRRVYLKHPEGNMLLIYRLIKSPAKGCNKTTKTGSVFSLVIIQKDSLAPHREIIRLTDIARDIKEAFYIFDMVSRYAVTPCTAAETVSDLIGIPR